MAMLVLESWVEEKLRADREANGLDRFDEVWDGTYIMSPLPNDEHQAISNQLSFVFQGLIGMTGLGEVRSGMNVSDREEGWIHNYRIPDVVVFLRGNTARNLGTHWLGGPDLAVEVLSPGDRAREKLPFYAGIGTREVLVIDREPWRSELYRLEGGRLDLVGASDLDRPEALASEALPLTFRLIDGETRPKIEVTHEDGRTWLA